MPRNQTNGLEAFLNIQILILNSILSLPLVPKTVMRNKERRRRRRVQQIKLYSWWARPDSNRRPLQCQCSALPTELRALRQRYYSVLLVRSQEANTAIETKLWL
jgi:hypothetical protein